MLIKPDLKDEEIIACLQDAYGLTIEKVVFLPLGADFNMAVLSHYNKDPNGLFPTKLRSGEFFRASVSVQNTWLILVSNKLFLRLQPKQVTLDRLGIIQGNSLPLYRGSQWR